MTTFGSDVTRARRARRLGLSLLLLAVLSSGPIYQFAASAYDRYRFPPPGQLIDVGGYRLHLNCTGDDSASLAPTVVLEGGLGAPSLVWVMVQAGLAHHARVCSYDRAGYGWSDPGPRPRTGRVIAQELHALLHIASEAPPYVLVGHSLGGVFVRLYTAEYPDEVAGLILVDARHEDFFERMPPEYLQTDEANRRRTQWLTRLTPLGYTRLAGNVGALDTFELYLAPLPDAVEEEAWALMIYNSRHWATALAEREASEECYRQVRGTKLPETLPLVVLTAENGVGAWRAGNAPVAESAYATWMQLQKEQAALTSRGQWVIVPHSGHYIYFDQPQAIVDAALTLLRP